MLFYGMHEKSDSGTDDTYNIRQKAFSSFLLLAAIKFTFCLSENVTDNKAFDELQYVVKLKAF